MKPGTGGTGFGARCHRFPVHIAARRIPWVPSSPHGYLLSSLSRLNYRYCGCLRACHNYEKVLQIQFSFSLFSYQSDGVRAKYRNESSSKANIIIFKRELVQAHAFFLFEVAPNKGFILFCGSQHHITIFGCSL